MSEAVVHLLNSLFLDDASEYAGAFQREMVVRFSASPGDVVQHVRGTMKYATFLASRAQRFAPSLSGDTLTRMSDAVASELISGTGVPGIGEIERAVRASEEWRAWKRDQIVRAAEDFGRALSDGCVEALMDVDDRDMRAAMSDRIAISDRVATEEAVLAETSEDAVEPVVLNITVVEAARDATLDEGFMAAFASEYGRDPCVHEYVHVRNILADDSTASIATVHAAHDAAYRAFEEIYRELMDEAMTESDFCRRFLPDALLDADMAERHRETILGSSGYRANMCGRLVKLHKMLFGEEIGEIEADYMFRTSVRKQRLPLQSEKINDVVVAFAEQTTRLCSLITSVYVDTFGREPEDAEARDVLQSFRLDEPGATRDLRRSLTRSLEFREVLRLEILRACPDLSVPAVFRRLEAVLAQPGLERMTSAQAVEAQIGKAQ